MADGNQRLLQNNPEKTQYSAMEMENPDSSSTQSPLIDGENQSSLRINKRALVVFFGVTSLAAAVIIVAVFVTLYSGNNAVQTNRLKRDKVPFSLDDYLDGTYNPMSYQVTWISDDQYWVRGPGGSIDIIDQSKDETNTLVDATHAKDWTKFFISPSLKYVLVAKNLTSQYRYSTFADYYIFDVKTKKEDKINSKSKIQYAEWNPAKDAVVFVADNDMYYIKDVLKPDDIQQLTNTGKKHVIFNGVPDWVYQEEVLNSDHALYFSKDGKYLTYIVFDDTKVKDYVFSWFGSSDKEYISQHKIAYPKPGTGNPVVDVKVIDLEDLPADPKALPSSKDVQPPSQMENIEHYVVEIGWLSSSIFSVQWLTRTQHYSINQLCLIKNRAIDCDTLKGHEVNIKGGWVDDKYMLPQYYGAGQKPYYLTTHPFEQGNAGNFTHIGQVDIMTGEITALTSGEWVVTKIYVFDDKNEIVYFESTLTPSSKKGIPSKKHIYSYSVKDRKMACLSCSAPGVEDGDSGYFTASFSKKGQWYVLHCLGPAVPWLRMYSTRNPGKGKILEINNFLKDKLAKFPKLDPKLRTEYIKVKSEDSDNNIIAKVVYPPNFDRNNKYAVFFSVYGGPGTQNVVEAWGLGYETGYLSTNYDMIIVYVDARGTMGRGDRYKNAVYGHLGRYEALDTITVAKHMANMPFVDKNKIAIWGWSYGGYLSSYILGSQKTKVFSLAMAVAPVADWRYYDSIYTERYMGLPKDNVKGYESASVLPLVNNFKKLKVDYLLVHGTGDDNVHFQNSAQLVRVLTELEIKYRVQFYPDKDHSLGGEGTRTHLFHLLTSFLLEKEHIKQQS